LPLFGQCPSAPGLSVLDVSAEVAANSVLDSADGNIARAADATFFNSTWRGPAHNGHKAEFINDGVYGDSNGIFFRGSTTSEEIYVGIHWDTPKTIREVALGRDSVNHDQGGTDRAAGAYTFEYTTDAFTPVSCPDNSQGPCDDAANVAVTWCPMGLADDHLSIPFLPNDGPTTRGARRRYTLPEDLTGVTAVRIVTQVENVIDELEIGSSVGSLAVEPCPTAGTPGLTFLSESAERSPNSVPEFAAGNIARAPDATFFNSSYRNGHDASFINDGIYGDSNGIYFRHSGGGPVSGEVYVGIHWATPKTIREVAIGRDAVNHAHGDRSVGAYTFEYTTDVFTPVSCPAEGQVCDDLANTTVRWCPLGIANEHSSEPLTTSNPTTRGARRRYTLPEDLTGVTAVRVISQVENVIDELEIGDSAEALSFTDPCAPTPGFALVEESEELEAEDVPSFEDGNLARAPDATFFNSSYRNGHDASFINDGLYGDSNGIYFRHIGGGPASGEAYVGIRWSTPKSIREVAIGRDAIFHNHFNRAVGAYTFEYTTDAFTSVSCPAEGEVCDDAANFTVIWCPLGLANDHSSQSGQAGPSTRGARRLYTLPYDVEVMAVRVVSQVENVIDELEIYGQTVTLEGGNLAGDCNQDGSVDLSDVICLLGFLFQNNPVNLPCINGVADLALMDVNNDLSIDLSDGIYTLAFLFQGGPGPAQGVNCFSIPGCPQNASCP
jgi:hypothetical protein